MEEEVDGQEEKHDDRREDRQQREESGEVEEKPHTQRGHGDDTWNVMCARQPYDLSFACACHSMCNTEKM